MGTYVRGGKVQTQFRPEWQPSVTGQVPNTIPFWIVPLKNIPLCQAENNKFEANM